MGVVDGFDSTWSNAKSTFGQGTPQDGRAVRQQRSVAADAVRCGFGGPDSRWTGSASDSYASANDKQGRVLGQIADLDQRLRTEVDRSAQVVNAGRQNLDSVRQWVHDAAATVPAGQNRDRMLYPIVSKGAAEIADILQRSNSDLNTIAGRVRSLSGEYQMLGGDLKQGTGPDGEKPDTLTEEERKKQEEEVKKRAQADVKAALDGDKGAVQRVQNVLDTVSKEQQAGQAKLNAEQQAYLSQMQAQQKLRNVDQLEEAANKGAREIMADSWQLMSNPKVEFPKTESVDGAVQSNEMITAASTSCPTASGTPSTRPASELGEPAEGRRHRRRWQRPFQDEHRSRPRPDAQGRRHDGIARMAQRRPLE